MEGGCGCLQQKKDRACYEKIKEVAVKFAKATNQVVCLYQFGEGWDFCAINTREFNDIAPVEFIHPLQ